MSVYAPYTTLRRTMSAKLVLSGCLCSMPALCFHSILLKERDIKDDEREEGKNGVRAMRGTTN